MARKGTQSEKINSKVLEMLKSNPDGIRWSELVRELERQHPKIRHGAITGAIWDFLKKSPEIYKVARGLYRHTSYRSEDERNEGEDKIEKTSEEDFYKPFADWLVNESEECTRAIPLGGSKFGKKWGTPDVIGVRESERGDVIQFATEIVSAELKTDTRDLITAFGQACAYKLFSHKSYIVVPKSSLQDDVSRLGALCLILGIGLVLFDNEKPDDPRFEIKVSPMKHEPDMFYVNKYLKLIVKDLWRK
jgi:hypothetical protein